MKWDKWRYSEAGVVVFYQKTILRLFGCKIDIHKMVHPDKPGCYHTHPATAIRVILWGGYSERIMKDCAVGHDFYSFRTWCPGMIGVVKPDYCHRIYSLINNKVSYSLWIRFRKTHDIKLMGKGWETK